MDQVEDWIVAALHSSGGQMKLRDLIQQLEASCPLSPEDRAPQKGHEQESQFAYRCRWAVTRLRNKGVILRPGVQRGLIQLDEGTVPTVAVPSGDE